MPVAEIPNDENFPPTRWSQVLAAGRGSDFSCARAALSELCRVYWFPLYAFARRRGLEPEDAEDCTQMFFASLVEKNRLALADRAVGRLRTFLLAACRNHVEDFRRSAGAEKRGGKIHFIPIETAIAEQLYQAELADGRTAEAHFERQWALTVLDTALAALRAEYAASSRGDLFDVLRPFINPTQAGDTEPAAAAESLGITTSAVRQAAHRLRERFRDTLRRHLADTLDFPTDETVDAELRALRVALAA